MSIKNYRLIIYSVLLSAILLLDQASGRLRSLSLDEDIQQDLTDVLKRCTAGIQRLKDHQYLWELPQNIEKLKTETTFWQKVKLRTKGLSFRKIKKEIQALEKRLSSTQYSKYILDLDNDINPETGFLLQKIYRKFPMINNLKETLKTREQYIKSKREHILRQILRTSPVFVDEIRLLTTQMITYSAKQNTLENDLGKAEKKSFALYQDIKKFAQNIAAPLKIIEKDIQERLVIARQLAAIKRKTS